jgi:hypothetical protein
MRDTSLLAYQDLKPKLGDKQQSVLILIHAHPDCTDLELTYKMGYTDPNKVRPRRKELLDYGLIVESGKRRCSVSGKLALTWRVKPR